MLVYFPACTGQKQTSEINESEFLDVFVVGQESITSQDNIPYYQIRTPNIVMTNSGRLILICQGRNKSDWSDRSGQDLICKTSDDEGITWSEPREISHMMATDETPVIFGAGEGIQLTKGIHKGRLIIPGGDHRGNRIVYAIYSDDHGKTWQFAKK